MEQNKKSRFVVFSTFYPFRGGIAQFSALLFRALEKKEKDVKAVTFKRQYPNILFPGKTQFVSENDQADQIPATQVLDSINPITYLKTSRFINRMNPSVFISNYWMPFFAPSIGLVSLFLKKSTKKIAVLHNVIPHEKQFLTKFLTRFFLKRNDGFVVMSDAVANDLKSIYPQAKYIQVNHPIYNQFGIKIDKNEACSLLKIDPFKKTILFFGFIRTYKGLDVLLEAFDGLDEDYQLIIAGEVYGDFKVYDDLIQKSKNKHNIHLFTDYIEDAKVTIYFSAADVCVLPYKSATQSGITAIAYHFDLPIIATDVGGLKETIKHEETGLIASKADKEEIRNLILKYFNTDNRNHYEEAIQVFKKENSWDNFAQKIIDFSKTI